MKKDTVRMLACSTLFQVYWFALVWSAGSKLSVLLALLCLGLMIGQFMVYARPVRQSLLFLASAVFFGVLMDSVLTAFGVHNPVRVVLPSPLAPAWLIGLWIAFAGYIRTGLDGLRGKYILHFFLGFIFGPLAWVAGRRMGAAEVNSSLLAGYGVMAVCWGVAVVILFIMSDRMREKDE